MTAVGVRQLKARASELLRQLEDGGEPIEITKRGKVIARLVPAERPWPTREEIGAWWTDHDHLAQEIGSDWPEGVSAVEAVREQRREL
jgi:prevent-host-death family protein